MKLKREEFNVLIPPCMSGGGGNGPKITGVEPIEIIPGDSGDGDGDDGKGSDKSGNVRYRPAS